MKRFFLDIRIDADDDDDPMMFEAELAMLDEVEAEGRNDPPVIGHGPKANATNTRWSRPCVLPLDPITESLVFQQLDVDYYTGEKRVMLHCGSFVN